MITVETQFLIGLRYLCCLLFKFSSVLLWHQQRRESKTIVVAAAVLWASISFCLRLLFNPLSAL
jgi:hypothetical protein